MFNGNGRTAADDEIINGVAIASDGSVIAVRAHTQPMLSHINVGTGVDVTIRELAETVARVAGFKGKLTFDASKPDGTPRKLLDVTRLARGAVAVCQRLLYLPAHGVFQTHDVAAAGQV